MKIWKTLTLVSLSLLGSFAVGCSKGPPLSPSESTGRERIVSLPLPSKYSEVSIEEALWKRRSIRRYAEGALSLQEVGQLLWAAQGVTNERGFRTAPSAGALYPLELYIVVGKVEGLSPGIYHYLPQDHALEWVKEGDFRELLARAALDQAWVQQAALDIVFAAIYERTTRRYGFRGVRYVHMEVGHAAENVYLQAVSLELGTVAVGAFHDEQVRQVLGLSEKEVPLYIMPVGRLR